MEAGEVCCIIPVLWHVCIDIQAVWLPPPAPLMAYNRIITTAGFLRAGHSAGGGRGTGALTHDWCRFVPPAWWNTVSLGDIYSICVLYRSYPLGASYTVSVRIQQQKSQLTDLSPLWSACLIHTWNKKTSNSFCIALSFWLVFSLIKHCFSVWMYYYSFLPNVFILTEMILRYSQIISEVWLPHLRSFHLTFIFRNGSCLSHTLNKQGFVIMTSNLLHLAQQVSSYQDLIWWWLICCTAIEVLRCSKVNHSDNQI